MAKFKLYKKIWEQQQQSEKTRMFAEREQKGRIDKGHLERDSPAACDYAQYKRLLAGIEPLPQQHQKVADDMDE